jgi:N-acetylglutamate synthase-like GNAT family acetyltransferase
VRKFLIAGSCFEYGAAAAAQEYVRPDCALQPAVSYPISKAAASVALLGFARERNVCLQLLRIFQVYGEGEAVTRCANLDCPAQLVNNVRHFASRAALDIEGLGDKLVQQLVEQGRVTRISDVFRLDAATLAGLERMGEKSAANRIAALERARQTAFARFLYGLGIRHVGAGVAVLLADRFAGGSHPHDLFRVGLKTLKETALRSSTRPVPGASQCRCKPSISFSQASRGIGPMPSLSGPCIFSATAV